MKKLSLILVALLALACLMPALAESFTQPAVVAATSEDEFIGSWSLCGVLFTDYDTFVTPEQLDGITADVNIVSGRASLTFDGQTYSSPSSLHDDGTLVAVDSDGTTSTFYLNDNGWISVEMTSDGIHMIMYFEPVQ